MNQTLQAWLNTSIQGLKDQHLYKVPRILDTPAGGRVTMDGKAVINLSSNNYLGLADHPKVKQAALDAVERWGVGAGAVRWIGGTMQVHDELEQRLAKFKRVEAVLVFTSGFTANSGCIPAVLTKDDVVISDALNHASIIDGVRLGPAKYRKSEGYVYDHKDMGMLEEILTKTQNFSKRMIITDGVFSMDGDIAPLDKIYEVTQRYDLLLMVDDAHGEGVLGKGGRGIVDHFGLHGKVDIEVGTMSKAFGVMGGVIAGNEVIVEWLHQRGRPFLFSSAMTIPDAAACLAAVDLLEESTELVDK
ncbi:MAG: aminotransferase class I/II-fold pyridoxal phosphate-dependent enzyme, partial [Armatimonadetes bacterium]|nr:aminotransferase class I/II-fold pyridoxal phosphate-dependent enzyme [Armatimonadota bacterium]